MILGEAVEENWLLTVAKVTENWWQPACITLAWKQN